MFKYYILIINQNSFIMKTVLLKTKLSKITRYRLFEIKDSSLTQLGSELTLPDIISEITRLDFPIVWIEISYLPKKEIELINSNSKLKELSTAEKCRYKYYRKKLKKTRVQ